MFRHGMFRSAGLATAALMFAVAGQPVRAAEVQGVVKNSSGAPVAGAFVKLKNADRRLTFMVISQDQGRFTAKNLPAGKYVVQGIGGEFQSALSNPVDVADGRAATVDVSLTTARAPQLAAAWPGQLPGQQGGEAEAAAPGAQPTLPAGDGARIVLTKCSQCHDAQRIVRARYDRARWEETVDDMSEYVKGSTFATDVTEQESKTLVDYLVANFTGTRGAREERKPDPNSRLPRTLMQGDQRKYVAVEYELPNLQSEPHEVAVDSDANGWVTQRRGGKLGRLDQKTLLYTEIAPPPAVATKLRLNGIVTAPNNKLWFVDGGPNRRFLNLDTKTREFNVFNLPKLKSGNASGNTMRVHPDGTVWLNSIAGNEIIQLNPTTRDFKVFTVPAGEKAGRSASPYGMAISGDGKIWFVENAMDQVGRLDPATGKFDEYPIPVPKPTARKAGMDSEGNPWVGLHGAGKLMKIDYKTIKMTVYDPPTKNSGVYSVQGDPKSKLVWFSQQHVDQIARFDPTTETFTEFPLPTAEEDHRRIDVDANNPNRIWWSGNLSGRMGYIEMIN